MFIERKYYHQIFNRVFSRVKKVWNVAVVIQHVDEWYSILASHEILNDFGRRKPLWSNKHPQTHAELSFFENYLTHAFGNY